MINFNNTYPLYFVMRDYFQRLFKYNQWCNLQLVEHLKPLPYLEQVMLRLSHIVSAEEVWYQRVKPLGHEPLPLFEPQQWPVLTPRLEESAQRWLDLVNQQEDYKSIISYQTTSGTPYETPLDDILIHLANHGTYHRGQIATLLRQLGYEPLATDYIVFCRALER